jgi:hypothetical protein
MAIPATAKTPTAPAPPPSTPANDAGPSPVLAVALASFGLPPEACGVCVVGPDGRAEVLYPDLEPDTFDPVTLSQSFKRALRHASAIVGPEGPVYKSARGGSGASLVTWQKTGHATIPYVAIARQLTLPAVKP